jgi:putative NADH-flavin reductase
MKIALIGASGFVGSLLLTELLKRHHEVTAIVRHPEKITIEDSLLKVVKADALNANEVAEAVKGNDVVLSAFNPGWTNPNIYDDFLKGAKAIQEGTQKAGVEKLLVIGGAGSLYDESGKQLVDSPDFPEAIKPGATAARDYYESLKNESDLNWTFFSPAIEMHRGVATGRTGKYRLGTEKPVFDEAGRSILSGEDLAVVIADELENPKHERQRFTAAY